MSNTVSITVEDPNTRMVTYESVRLETATAADGVFTLLTALPLVADTYYYSYLHTAGVATTWYRYAFYHSTGPVFSSYSNPFQSHQITRLDIMHKTMEDYDTGYVLELTSGSTTTVLRTNDYRVKDGKTTGIGKGGWIRVCSGTYASQITNISDIDHSTGYITVTPALTGSPSSGDIIEWHWLTTPTAMIQAINRGLERYQVLDRVPIVGDGTGTNLLDYLPWLFGKEQVAGLWRTFPTSNIPEVPWDWWNIRSEDAQLTLLSYPPIQSTDTVYIECLRYLQPLSTDDSSLHPNCRLELAAALTYDEALRVLTTPGSVASNQDRTVWGQARLMHKYKLRLLWRKWGPKFRQQRIKGTGYPTAIPLPWTPR